MHRHVCPMYTADHLFKQALTPQLSTEGAPPPEIKIGGASANSDWSSSSLLVASRSLCLHSLLLFDRRLLPIT